MSQTNKRNSNIEFLKILAIVLIVINHSVQTVTILNPAEDYLATGLTLTCASERMDFLILVLFRHFGAIGNGIFAVASFYFLCTNNQTRINKVVSFILDCWLISVLILVLTFVFAKGCEPELILKSLLPLTFNNNWYITCYLMIYLCHDVLNTLIDNLSKRRHFWLFTIMIIIYCGFSMISYDFYYYTHFMLFLTIYIYISYQKKYLQSCMQNKKLNMIVLATSLLILLFMIVITNYMGLRIPILHDKMFFWAKTNNPLTLIIALSLFNIAISMKCYVNKYVNRIAGLSLIIYLIHDNIIVRHIWRHRIWEYVYMKLNFITNGNVVIMVIILSLLVLVISLMVGMIYVILTKRLITYLSKVVSLKMEGLIQKVRV